MLIIMSSSTIGIIAFLGLTGLCLGVAVPANNALAIRSLNSPAGCESPALVEMEHAGAFS
jgi:hypothetical protein